jgi:DNA-binding MarR family transcriptional regulator
MPAKDSAGQPETPLEQGLLPDLVGYNCRRAYLRILKDFVEGMAPYRLRPVEFSVLAVLDANDAVTHKRLSQALAISPPNLAVLLDRLQERGLLERARNPRDGRSSILTLTRAGRALFGKARGRAVALELDATSMLSDRERETLVRLLQKVYRGEAGGSGEATGGRGRGAGAAPGAPLRARRSGTRGPRPGSARGPRGAGAAG